MKKVNRLRNRIEPFAALFWALGNVLAKPDPAYRPGITPPPYTRHVLILALNEDDRLPPFSYLVCYLSMGLQYTIYIHVLLLYIRR